MAVLQEFTAKGYAGACLDAIAVASEVSKRMLHYHCGDKLGFYRAMWVHVLEVVGLDDNALCPHSNVSVEALQHVVGIIYNYPSANPLAARFIIQENLYPVLLLEGVAGLGGQSPIVLESDRILLLGRDYGTFHTDISALDLYILVLSPAIFPTLHQQTFESLYGIEMQLTMLLDKLRESVRDTVTSLLTSSPRNEPGGSYTSLLASHGASSSALDAEIYGDQPNPETQDLTIDDVPDCRNIHDMND